MTFKDAQNVKVGDLLIHNSIKDCFANVTGAPILNFPHWAIPVDVETTAFTTTILQDGTPIKQYFVDGRRGYCWSILQHKMRR